MKRLIMLVVWAVAATPARAEVDRAVLIALSASVLKIEALRAQGGYALGSGVVVAPEKIATNCHVTRDALKIHVLRAGVRWPATPQRSDVERDLCLLHVPGLQSGVVALGRADQLTPGQAVTALGYTGGLGLQSSQGEVLALHRFDGSRVIQSSNWFSSGASGGGLFDEDLHLVGILTFRLRGGEAHYFAAPAEWLLAMLDAPQGHGDHDRSPQPLAYWQQPVLAQPRFLKAALLQRDDQWQLLETLATEWARADPGDAEPWYLMGLALAQMNRLAEAQLALECSLALEPASAAARARLESVHGLRGLPRWTEQAVGASAPPCDIAVPALRTP
jgi:serine protease Do